MSVHSSQKKKRKDCHRIKFKGVGNHDEFMERITKTLYYGKLPISEAFSLPVSELAAELYSEVKKTSISLERLRMEEASEISWNACVSPCSFVLAMLYLERLKTCNPAYVDKIAPSELFLVSLMVATKFLSDSGEDDDVLNCEWAASSGLTLKTVNQLEKEFLDAINWEVFVKESAFWETLRGIERTIAMKEGKKRGWFSYTDLELLMDYIDALSLAQAVFTVSAVCLASYAAGMLTVIGSTMLATQVVSNGLFHRNAIGNPNGTVIVEQPPRFTSEPVLNDFNGTYTDFICESEECGLEEILLESGPPSRNVSKVREEYNLSQELVDIFPTFGKDFLLPLSLYYTNSLSTITRHLDHIPLVGVMSK